MNTVVETLTMLGRLFFLAALALVACAPSPLTDRDFIVEVHEIGQVEVSTSEAVKAKLTLLDYLASAHPSQNSMEQFAERERPGIHAKISTYYLQYYGDHDEGGDKKILINGLCEMLPGVSRETMRKALVRVDDGGPCFFGAAYSPAQHRIIGFWVNGYA